jgi:hypothetical protein
VFQRNTLPPASGLKCKYSKNPAEAGDKLSFFLGLFFDPEDGGNAFLQNVGLQSKKSGTVIEKNVIHFVHNTLFL